MEIEQPNNNEQGRPSPEDATKPETRPPITPRIYVASLSDYNNGILHGEWLDADSDPDELISAIQTILDHSPTGQAEEFAIFDFEGFGPWRLSEYESITMVTAVAQGMAEHGPAFAHWVDEVEANDSDDLMGFEDAYLGHWESVEEYAEELLTGSGMTIDALVPDAYSAYVWIDYEGFARDLELSGDITTSEGDGGVYIFEGHR
jgi:antirestriction protein